MQTVLALTDLSQVRQNHIPGPSLHINDKQARSWENCSSLTLCQPDCCILLPDKHNICYLNDFNLLDKHPTLSPSLTRYCWQSFTMFQGSSWWLSGYSALSAHLGLLNLVASFLMISWVQKNTKPDHWLMLSKQPTTVVMLFRTWNISCFFAILQ